MGPITKDLLRRIMEGGGLTPKSELGGYSSPAQSGARGPGSGFGTSGTPTVAPEARNPFTTTTTPMATQPQGSYVYDENKGVWGAVGSVTPVGIIGDGKPASSNLLGSQTQTPTQSVLTPSPTSSQIAPGTYMYDSVLGIWGPAGQVTPLGTIGASSGTAPAAPTAKT